MASRIDIEITSDRGDGTYTWRAAGAKQPKGTLSASLLPAGVVVGAVVRADAEFTVDGPEIISVMAPKAAAPDTTERLELLGSGRSDDGGGVTTQLAKKSRRGGGRAGGRRNDRGGGPRNRGDRSGRPKPLRMGRAHREAWIASLPETRRPIAEQLMHEGRDGVAAALERQNKAAAADGRDTIDVGPTMRIADELGPALAVAEAMDRFDAAIDSVDSADLRELRRTLATGGDDVPQDRKDQLRTKLTARIDREQAAWLREVREAVKEDRIVRALQRSGRPIKAGAPLPDDLVQELCTGANSAFDPDDEPRRWIAVVEALAASPIRRLITPEAIPEQQDDELLDTVDRLAHLVPGVASAFGVDARPAPKRRGRR